MKDKFSIAYQPPRTDWSATDGWQADICKSGFEDCLWNNKQFKTTITTVRIRLCFCSVLWSIKSFAWLAYNGPVHHIWFLRFGSQKQYKASLSLSLWYEFWNGCSTLQLSSADIVLIRQRNFFIQTKFI